jgi:hypothetical protein
MCCVKTSILVTLGRIKHDVWWRVCIWILIAIQVIYTVGDVIVEWVFFKTLTSLSCAESIDDPCSAIFTITNYVEASFPLATDVIISLLPIAFLIQLRRPLWERLLIGALMSLGLVASTFSILKMINNTSFDESQALADLTVAFYTYSAAELFIGIIAACLFSLKSAFYQFLKGFGIDITPRMNRSIRNADDLPDFDVLANDNTMPLEHSDLKSPKSHS